MILEEKEHFVEIDIKLSDGTLIGTAEIEPNEKMLERFSIFEPYQNKGYGQQVLSDLIDAYGIKNCGYVLIMREQSTSTRKQVSARRKKQCLRWKGVKMTLDEAIKHAEEVAKDRNETANLAPTEYENYINSCRRCAEEHRQLAEWLKELKQLREQTRWIPVSERLPEYSGNYLIAIADNDCPTVQFFEISWFYSNTHSWSYLNADVIAWMPLPEPYAEGEDKE